MRDAVERWLGERWYGGAPPGIGLRALAGVYRTLSAQPSDVPIRVGAPVVVVGNFTVGGSGKTPLVIALSNFLTGKGYRPGIVTRGYGRRVVTPVVVTRDTPVEHSGDEPKLMQQRTDALVVVNADRVAAAALAVSRGCNVIIADDGLQHRRLARDVEIEVVDAQRGYGNGLLLPAGPLREVPRPCDFRVLNGGSSKASDVSMHLLLDHAIPLHGPGPGIVLSELPQPVHAFAGIGNPQRFFTALRAAGLAIIEHAFSDHHAFRMQDFAGISGSVLMTEKDAVKCRALDLANAWYAPIDAQLPEHFFAAILQRIEATRHD